MDIKVRFKAGGSFVGLRPQFSFDSESIYVAWKNQILGYNTKTGALVAEFKGIKDHIVGFGIHYHDSYECITACSTTGEIITWKIVTYFKILNKKIEKTNIRTFHFVPSETDEIRALISYKQKGKILFCLFDLKTEVDQPYNLEIYAGPNSVDICSNKFFAVIQKNILNIVPFDDFSKTHTYRIENSRHFTCIACHSDREIVLTGDQTGRVVVWQKLFTRKPSQAVFHWHTLPVQCLSFSVAGSYFYSGGLESVLVRWQLDNHFEKKFLPRLPSTIAQVAVSPNNTFIAIATNDNAVRIVDSRLDNVSLIQHLVIGDNFQSGIVLDPRTKALVMNGNVGQIQFYSPSDNSLLYNVDIVGQNKISNERNCSIENTQVSKIAMTRDGLWMATVEIRQDPEFSPELRLKFWYFDLEKQNFRLNTSVESPHENHINSILFQPMDNKKEQKCVSVGGDKKFKVWFLTETESVNNKSFIWKCLCIGFYHDLPCKSLSFSNDGSLVAVSFNNVVTTWLPDSCQLKCSLVHPVYEEEIDQVEFGTSNQCHLLVTASKERLSVWNLLTLTMVWTVPAAVSLLIADSVTTNMAIITENKKVFVFTPNSPEPIFSSDKLLQNHKYICAAAFVPSKFSNDVSMKWSQRSPILFINSNRELFCLGSEEEVADTPQIDEFSKSLFSMMIPQSQTNTVHEKEPVQHTYAKDIGQKAIKKVSSFFFVEIVLTLMNFQYFEAPIQTMIPIRIMCNSLL
ncbi:WD repeat-containing protein 75, partial [Asbolus verrucosus]